MKKPIIPIEVIGEENWVEKLTVFLEDYEVEVEICDTNSNFKLPEQMKDYYENFGNIDSSDFMYGLYKPKDFVKLIDSDWSFLKENFNEEELEKYLVFSITSCTDPICLNMQDFSIHLFSHDPVRNLKVFKDFNQYLRYEIIEIQKLMGDVNFEKEEEIEYHKKYLKDDGIDYEFRYMKFG